MDINLLVKITARAWSLGILAAMHKGSPGRQVTLYAASGATGRTAFSQSLDHLIHLGLLERTPGHGHPLRPEYRLTPRGAEVAPMAERILSTAPKPGDYPLLKRAWTLPVLAISHKPIYFTDFKNRLAPITDRALSQSLKQLERQDWLRRSFETGARTPRPLYQAANMGFQISQAINLAAL